MNWAVFFFVLAIFSLAAGITAAGIYAINRGLNPAWFVTGLFLAGAIVAGVLTR